MGDVYDAMDTWDDRRDMCSKQREDRDWSPNQTGHTITIGPKFDPKNQTVRLSAEELREIANACRFGEATGLKPTNPKDAIGSDKLPLHLWPETATAMGCLGLLEGMLKYGRANWRDAGIRYTIYVDALRRHVNALFEGEDFDPDSGLPHEAHALACLAILIDAKAAGKLNDDRQYPGGYRKLVTELTPHVKRLKELHKDKNPHHYTIADKRNEE